VGEDSRGNSKTGTEQLQVARRFDERMEIGRDTGPAPRVFSVRFKRSSYGFFFFFVCGFLLLFVVFFFLFFFFL